MYQSIAQAIHASLASVISLQLVKKLFSWFPLEKFYSTEPDPQRERQKVLKKAASHHRKKCTNRDIAVFKTVNPVLESMLYGYSLYRLYHGECDFATLATAGIAMGRTVYDVNQHTQKLRK